MSVEISYETHSTSVDNERGVATGWLPGQLSMTGRLQARRLGERHRNHDIAAVFASDLARAVETANIAFAETNVPIYQDERLRECNYGVLNGMPVAQLIAGRAEHIAEPYPEGESYNQVVARMRSFLRDLASGWDGKRVVVIAHSANRWALDHLLKGIPLEDVVEAPFRWQEGWVYQLPRSWTDGLVRERRTALHESSTSRCSDIACAFDEGFGGQGTKHRSQGTRHHGRPRGDVTRC